MKYTKKPLFHGYANQILTIDVGTGKIEPRPLEEKVRDFFIGGRGLGLYLLHQKINAQTKADDPANPLILAPGPLGGIPQFPEPANAWLYPCLRSRISRAYPISAAISAPI